MPRSLGLRISAVRSSSSGAGTAVTLFSGVKSGMRAGSSVFTMPPPLVVIGGGTGELLCGKVVVVETVAGVCTDDTGVDGVVTGRPRLVGVLGDESPSTSLRRPRPRPRPRRPAFSGLGLRPRRFFLNAPSS